jgi:hypothetical protein
MFQSKKDFSEFFKGLINPLKNYYTPKNAGLKLGNFAVSYSEDVANMEGFSRVLWGLAPLWAGGEDADGFADIYLQGIISGTDPESEEYWGEIPASSSDQRIVEMAALGLALILAPEKIWKPLNEKQKKNLHTWLWQVNNNIESNNNWQLFPLIVNLGFKCVGAEYDAQRMKRSLASLDSFYRADGWYHDGNSDQVDYYVPFALHFYALIYAKVMEKEDPENSRIIKERALLFAQSFVYWFDENGSALAFGRSLIYRFAQCCFFSACVFAGIEPFPIGVMKGIIVRHFEWWISQKILDERGVLTVGYAYPNLNMAEFYNGYGSPYWSLKAFLFLALPEDHAFFKAEALPLPSLAPLITIPEAYMTVQRINGYAVALTGGQWASWHPTHCPEKYSKFAYSSRYAFNVSRTRDCLSAAAPDSTLAFEVDGKVFYREKCTEHRIEADGSHYSKWSPCRGITVETILTPTENGHIRRHTVDADFDCVAYDTAFATPLGGGGEIHGEGEEMTIVCEPNTNLIYPKCEMKAVKYEFKKGKTTVETTVIYPKD